MIRFELPSLGADMEEGTLLEWRVQPGDRVARGQVVALVDTSKAAVEVEIWKAGTVGELLVAPGQRIPVGTVMATLFEPGESAPAGASAPGSGPTAAPVQAPAPAPLTSRAPLTSPAPLTSRAPLTSPAPLTSRAPLPASALSPVPPVPPVPPVAPGVPAAAAQPASAATTAAPGTGASPPPASVAARPVPLATPDAVALTIAARHPVSPAARRRARELGVDPDGVVGTGHGGAVTIDDVERAAARSGAVTVPVAAKPADAAAPAASGSAAGPTVAATPATAATAAIAPAPAPSAAMAAAARQREMRRAIAAAMSRSKREIPHYYLSEQIPMSAALEWLQQRNAGVPITQRILPAVLQLKAVALALAEVPELNGMYRDGTFEPSAAVHAGVAISLRGGGLVAPAIHDVEGKALDVLMHDLSDLVRRARAGSLRSSEMTDPTITVTNLGDQGVESVFGVIYPPQVALVGFGRVAERAWAQDGWIRALPVVTASLAADHRVSDGHRGARFLATLRELLQHPQDLAGASTQQNEGHDPDGP